MSTFPPHILQLHQIKRAARSLWERTKFQPHKQNYNRATQDLKIALRNLKKEAFETELQALNATDGSLWRKTKLLTKDFEKIPPLKVNNKWLVSPEDKVNEFSKILSEQFQTNNIEDPQTNIEVENKLNQPLQLSPLGRMFTPSEVKMVICKLSSKKAPGSDHIVQPLLKSLPRKPLVFLTQIYNAMLRLSYFPSRWKIANIIMIPKPNKLHSNPLNYRPISLLPLFSKIFERLFLTKPFPFIESLLLDY